MYYMPYDLMTHTFYASHRQMVNEAKAYRSWQSINQNQRRLARLLDWGRKKMVSPQKASA